jgi:hypothetical protein
MFVRSVAVAMAKNSDDEIDRQRDEVVKRLIATPPKPLKDEPKRRPSPAPGVRQLPKKRTNKKRDKA